VRKNAYIVIKSRPCKVVDVSTSKTGEWASERVGC